jgi:hypothetical protein
MSEKLNYPYLDFPNVIDITLYKNNYYDNLIVNKIRKEADYGDLPDLKDCYIVWAKDFQEILYNSFSSEIDKIRSLPSTDLQKNATSLYFMDKIFSTFGNLKYVKVNVSRDVNYSRVNKAEKVPTIFFNYKITASCIDLTKIYDNSTLLQVNQLFVENGLCGYDNIVGYDHIIEIKAQEFIKFLEDNEDNPLTPYLFELIDPKTESDNPLIIFITDFDI